MNFGSQFSSWSRLQTTFFLLADRRSSHYHFLRVDDYGAAAHATKPARLRLVVSALVAEARLVFGACHFLARGTPVPSACVATLPGATLLIFMRLRTADSAQ